jgi:hypothetical protein
MQRSLFNRRGGSTTSAPPRGGVSRRRGVASVLAMMFLVIFGSLAAAMAVVAQGNLRTADSALKVSRAMSAAETGLVFASRRLAEESSRFIVDKGVVDANFAEKLWLGTYTGADGGVTVLPPNGYTVGTPPDGLAEAVRDAHLADEHDLIVDPADAALPDIDGLYGTLIVRPIALGGGESAPYFRLRYELLEDEPAIRVTSEGFDGDITRVLQMDFRLTKKIEYAVISPNRIMIGKNVMVEGPLGSRYGTVAGELQTEHGDPLVLRSDFEWLDDALDAKLATLFDAIVEYDVDGDARLRPDHVEESDGLIGEPDLIDYDGNEYVDDFDLFLAHYDSNDDAMVVYDSTLAAEVYAESFSDEFTDVDDQLARLIDEALPDRNGDGVVDDDDRAWGYRDGVLDINDQYAKVTGRLAFAVARSAWEAEDAHDASYQTVVTGPIETEIDDAPTSFSVSSEELLEITTQMFEESRGWFAAQGGASFASQTASGGTYTPAEDNEWEAVPFGSVRPYDYYQRPMYEDMTFNNVRIPEGNNGVFKRCIFVGVTYIEAETDCDHENWNICGSKWPVENPITGEISWVDHFPEHTVEHPDGSGDILTDTRPLSNNIRFEDCIFIGSLVGDRIGQYSYSYTHWRNKVQMTGNTRFYLTAEDEGVQDDPRWDEISPLIAAIDEVDRTELAKSSMFMPGWSMDVGNFTNDQGANPEDTPTVNLRGTIIAGILDIRGTADIFGTLLMTFRPKENEGPLKVFPGRLDVFNTTIGYFGPDDGDNEGSDPDEDMVEGYGHIRLRYNPNALLPDGIPWPMRIEPIMGSYVEGGTS